MSFFLNNLFCNFIFYYALIFAFLLETRYRNKLSLACLALPAIIKPYGDRQAWPRKTMRLEWYHWAKSESGSRTECIPLQHTHATGMQCHMARRSSGHLWKSKQPQLPNQSASVPLSMCEHVKKRFTNPLHDAMKCTCNQWPYQSIVQAIMQATRPLFEVNL